MELALIILAAAAALAFLERSPEHVLFAMPFFVLCTAVAMFVEPNVGNAILLSTVAALAIGGASAIKLKHSGYKLLASDLRLLRGGTVRFFVMQYPFAVLLTLVGVVALLLGVVAIHNRAVETTTALVSRIVVLCIAFMVCVVVYRMRGGSRTFVPIASLPKCFFSSFGASLIDFLAGWRACGLPMSDMAATTLRLLPPTPAATDTYPDIILIQHESVFDPRLFGLHIEPTVEAFLSPEGGFHGSLNVDIFGGGSWRSEFSVMTGLSSASFGANDYHIFKKGAGRFRHSLPRFLAGLGYGTMLASSSRRSFLDYDVFYRSIGFEHRVFSDDFPEPFNLRRFESSNSDSLFLEAAVGEFVRKVVAGRSAPQFLYALTNFNHGPHHRRLVATGQFEDERAFALASIPCGHYAEYYSRLAETAEVWRTIKSKLAMALAGRPVLIVHYGDHQPVMVRRIERELCLPQKARREFQTFFAMETLNFTHDSFASGRSRILDIAFLGTVTLQQAGLPLDEIFATRASLLEECREAYFASPSDRKCRFHRTLAEIGAAEIGCSPPAS